MRRELLISAAAGLTLFASACGDQTTMDDADTEAEMDQTSEMAASEEMGATEDADSANDPYAMEDDGEMDSMDDDADSLGQTEAVNEVQDAASGAVGMTSAAATGGDTESFVQAASIGNQYKIQAAELALEKSDHADIQALAQTILDDHRALGEELTSTLDAEGLMFTAPMTLDERRQGLIDNLQAATGEDFDETYLDQQIAAHQEALTLFKAQGERGDNAALSSLASSSVATLQAHLDETRAIEESVESNEDEM